MGRYLKPLPAIQKAFSGEAFRDHILPIVLMMTEFDRHVKHLLSIMVTKPRFVLGVADQVPPDGLERRVRRVSELVNEFGKY